MGTSADKLNKIIDTKNAIKTAINAKYTTAPITDSTKFADYPTHITNIPTGGGSGGDIINGITEQNVEFGENISQGDPIYITYKNSPELFNTTIHDTLPGVVNYCRFSPDGQYLVIGTVSSPYIVFIKLSDMSFNTLLDVMPTGQVRDFAWSPNGNFFVTVGSGTPSINAYMINKTTGDYENIAISDLPGYGYDCVWSPNSKYLFVSYSTSPYISVFDFSVDPVAVVDTPFVTNPQQVAYGSDISKDGKWLLLTIHNSPYVIGYDISSFPSERHNINITLSGACYAPMFLNNTYNFYFGKTEFQYLYMGEIDTNNNINLSSINSKFVNAADFIDYPINTVRDIRYDNDLNLLAVAQDKFPGIHLFYNTLDPYTIKRLNFPMLPTDGLIDARNYGIYSCDFSPDHRYLAIAGRSSISTDGYLAIYELKKVVLKQPNNKIISGGIAYGYAKETKSSGQTGKCGIITEV